MGGEKSTVEEDVWITPTMSLVFQFGGLVRLWGSFVFFFPLAVVLFVGSVFVALLLFSLADCA